MSYARRPVPFLAMFVCMIALGFVSNAHAQRSFHATLDGAQETPPNSTTATGSGTVVLNAAETQVTVSLNFSGLSSAQTAAHIHSPFNYIPRVIELFDNLTDVDFVPEGSTTTDR